MSKAAPPGWYPDPWGQAPQRFWDGWRWTPQIAASGAPVRSRLPEGAPIYGPAIWLLALSPLLGAVFGWLIQLDMSPFADYVAACAQAGADPCAPFPDPMSIFGAGYWVALFLSLVLTAGLIVLAYRDYQHLGRMGLVRPFHWAWAFLNPVVYVIGRGVIVRKVAAPRGLAPTWTAIAAYAVSVLVIGTWMAVVFFGLFAR